MPRKNVPLQFCQRAAASDTDECILWPFSIRSFGYGRLSLNGKDAAAHRFVCRLAHGDPPFDDAEAAHSCRNRHCVNPRHLRWATAKENAADKIKDGTVPKGEKNGFARLTEELVIEIRERLALNNVTTIQVAIEYGISNQLVSEIRLGNRWQHVGGPRSRGRQPWKKKVQATASEMLEMNE